MRVYTLQSAIGQMRKLHKLEMIRNYRLEGLRLEAEASNHIGDHDRIRGFCEDLGVDPVLSLQVPVLYINGDTQSIDPIPSEVKEDTTDG